MSARSSRNGRRCKVPEPQLKQDADGRVKPDVMAPGNPTAVVDGRGNIRFGSGTSFASPLLCGLVACLWQALPDKTAYEIMELVRKSGDRADSPDNVFGYGIADFGKALQAGLNNN